MGEMLYNGLNDDTLDRSESFLEKSKKDELTSMDKSEASSSKSNNIKIKKSSNKDSNKLNVTAYEGHDNFDPKINLTLRNNFYSTRPNNDINESNDNLSKTIA